MNYLRSSAIVTVLALAVPAVGFAQTAPAKAPTTTHAKPATKVPTASIKGVVKSTDATMVVITQAKGPEETFLINSSTERHGDLAVGATVNVHYRLDDGKKVATVVNVQAKNKTSAKEPATAKVHK